MRQVARVVGLLDRLGGEPEVLAEASPTAAAQVRHVLAQLRPARRRAPTSAARRPGDPALDADHLQAGNSVEHALAEHADMSAAPSCCRSRRAPRGSSEGQPAPRCSRGRRCARRPAAPPRRRPRRSASSGGCPKPGSAAGGQQHLDEPRVAGAALDLLGGEVRVTRCGTAIELRSRGSRSSHSSAEPVVQGPAERGGVIAAAPRPSCGPAAG